MLNLAAQDTINLVVGREFVIAAHGLGEDVSEDSPVDAN